MVKKLFGLTSWLVVSIFICVLIGVCSLLVLLSWGSMALNGTDKIGDGKSITSSDFRGLLFSIQSMERAGSRLVIQVELRYADWNVDRHWGFEHPWFRLYLRFFD